jgi:hypothetical protein
MIQKYKDWSILNESDIVEIDKEMKGFNKLKSTIDSIVEHEIIKLDELLDKIARFINLKEIDFIRWNDSPLTVNEEGDSITIEINIAMRFKNREREDFEETFASRFDPVDWKGTYIADSYEDAIKEVNQLLEEVKAKFKVDYQLLDSSFKKEALLPELRTKITISMKSILASIITTYLQDNRGKIQGKKFGL